MPEMRIPLGDIAIDPLKPFDVSSLPDEQAAALISKVYGFISGKLQVKVSGGIASIRWPDSDPKLKRKAEKWQEDGLGFARGGQYKKAIDLLERAMIYLPANEHVYRNLGMAYLESGNVQKGEELVVQAIRLNPQDPWSYLLLGNIQGKHKDDTAAAEKLYERAYELNPRDVYLLTNLGAMFAQREEFDKAKEWFQRALAVDPRYPNAHYGMALTYVRNGEPESARAALDVMFQKAQGMDVRSLPVWEEARRLYLEVVRFLANSNQEAVQVFLEERKQAVAKETGYPIEIVEDKSLELVAAKTEAAWVHGRDHHKIRYRPADKAVVTHLIAHELEHLLMDFENKRDGVQRFFATTQETRERAIRSIGDHIYKLQLMGYSEASLTQVMLQLIDGMANQLFNCPLDMVIEYRLLSKYPPPVFKSISLFEGHARRES